MFKLNNINLGIIWEYHWIMQSWKLTQYQSNLLSISLYSDTVNLGPTELHLEKQYGS